MTHTHDVIRTGVDLAKRLLPKLVTAAVVVVAAVCAYLLYVRHTSLPWTRDGQVRADVVQIAPRVSGYIVKIGVTDNQPVRKGDLLFEIDPSTYQLAVDQAQVALAQARQTVAELKAAVRAAEATVAQRVAAATSAESQIAAAQASVESATAGIAEAESGVVSAKATIQQVEAQLEEAEREADRAEKLADKKAGSVQTAEAKRASVHAYEAQVDSTRAGLKQSEASLEKSKAAHRESQAQLTIAENGLTEAQAAVSTANADLDQAKANLGEPGDANVQIRSAQVQLEQAKLDLNWTSIHAPADGYVTNMHLLHSTYVSAGTPFALFVDSSSFRVDSKFQETQIKNIAPGDRAIVTLMGHHDRPLEAVVESIGFAINPPNLAQTEGPENLVPTIEPTFEWIRLAQRVPVRIRFRTIPADLHLVSGMTASVAIQK
jgi:multidrug resistance efflux pump